MMNLQHSPLPLLFLTFVGCAAPDLQSDDERDSAFLVTGKADSVFGIEEDSYEAGAILVWVNDARRAELEAADLSNAAIEHITRITNRREIRTLQALDDIDFVGVVTFGKIVDAAVTNNAFFQENFLGATRHNLKLESREETPGNPLDLVASRNTIAALHYGPVEIWHRDDVDSPWQTMEIDSSYSNNSEDTEIAIANDTVIIKHGTYANSLLTFYLSETGTYRSGSIPQRGARHIAADGNRVIAWSNSSPRFISVWEREERDDGSLGGWIEVEQHGNLRGTRADTLNLFGDRLFAGSRYYGTTTFHKNSGGPDAWGVEAMSGGGIDADVRTITPLSDSIGFNHRAYGGTIDVFTLDPDERRLISEAPLPDSLSSGPVFVEGHNRREAFLRNEKERWVIPVAFGEEGSDVAVLDDIESRLVPGGYTQRFSVKRIKMASTGREIAVTSESGIYLFNREIVDEEITEEDGVAQDWPGFEAEATVASNEELHFRLPEEDAQLLPPGTYVIEMNGTNDADLYVRTGEAPTANEFDCRPYTKDSDEWCIVELDEAAAIFVMVRGYAESSSIRLWANRE